MGQTAEPLSSSHFPLTGPDNPPQAAEGKAGILQRELLLPWVISSATSSPHPFSHRPASLQTAAWTSGPTARRLVSLSVVGWLPLGNRHWDGDLHAITGKCAWERYSTAREGEKAHTWGGTISTEISPPHHPEEALRLSQPFREVLNGDKELRVCTSASSSHWRQLTLGWGQSRGQSSSLWVTAISGDGPSSLHQRANSPGSGRTRDSALMGSPTALPARVQRKRRRKPGLQFPLLQVNPWELTCLSGDRARAEKKGFPEAPAVAGKEHTLAESRWAGLAHRRWTGCRLGGESPNDLP